MTQITLTEAQVRALEKVREPVAVVDPEGRVLGHIDSPEFIKEVIAESKRRLALGEPTVPSEQVEAMLRALQEEWDRVGGFDRDYLRAFLERLRAERRQ